MRITSIRFAGVIALLLSLSIFFSGCALNRASKGPTLAEMVAGAYGIDDWDDVNELKFTFTMQSGGRRVVRSWIWEPKLNRITFEGLGPDKTQTGNHCGR